MENGSEQGSYDVDKGMAFGVLNRFFSIFFMCVYAGVAKLPSPRDAIYLS